MLVFWAANLPLLCLSLLVIFIVVSIVFAIRERGRLRRALTREIQSQVQVQLGTLIADILRQNEEARRQLASLAESQAALRDRKNAFEEQLAASHTEIEMLLAEVRRTAGEVAKLAPSRADLEWTSTENLLSRAAKAPDWPEAATCLTRIDRENATSGELEGAGDICRDRGVFARALEFYQEAAARDPDNLSARAEVLALTAETRPAERAESLQSLRELVAQNLAHPLYGTEIEGRYFLAMLTLGRHKEWTEFAELQLKQPLPRATQALLLRHLAICWQKLGRPEDALATCDAALKLSADDTELLSLYSRLLLGVKKYEEAYRAAIRVLQRNPACARNYIVLAEIQEKRIGRPAARDLLKRALLWASAGERFEIEDYQSKLAALDELSQIVPATQPQIIQA